MTGCHVLVLLPFLAGASLAFVAGYLSSRAIWYDRGWRAGTAWAGRVASRFGDDGDHEPTQAESTR